jgi:cell pole-organizing protein PopZ
MEDILSSIKRIIAEEGDPGQSRPRRTSRPTAAAPAPDAVLEPEPAEEVLELSHPIAGAAVSAPLDEIGEPAPAARPAAPPVTAAAPPVTATAPPASADSIVSQQAVAASRGSLEALSKMLVRPEPDGDGTLEGLVRELLRPMLREWLDANLPPLVETMVAREIEKITAQQ